MNAGPLRHVMVRIRLVCSAALGIVIYLLLPTSIGVPTRVHIGWNIGIAVFLVLASAMMAQSTHETMRKRARDLDEGRYAVLVLSVVAALSSLTAIIFEL